jgi:hypothetical protein
MNIILNESQYLKLLNEETGGLDLFIDQMVNRFPQLGDYQNIIKRNIENSNCQNISFEPMTFSSGLALHNKVVINVALLGYGKVFNYVPSISNLLYVIFHEIAHQHQYNKYSKELIYDIYTGELETEGAIKFLRYIENVADQFSMRKCRELQKLNVIPANEKVVDVGGYDNYTDKMFENYLNMLKDKVQKAGITDPEDISELIYNMIKPKL